jgi:hypothetical protein
VIYLFAQVGVSEESSLVFSMLTLLTLELQALVGLLAWWRYPLQLSKGKALDQRPWCAEAGGGSGGKGASQAKPNRYLKSLEERKSKKGDSKRKSAQGVSYQSVTQGSSSMRRVFVTIALPMSPGYTRGKRS